MSAQNWRAYIRWVYERDKGDLELLARSKDEALYTLSQYGFTKLDPKKLKHARAYHTVPVSLDGEVRPSDEGKK